MRPYTGLELYRGPSLLDGAPILALLGLHSGNKKTGDMCQTWILRQDQTPAEAIQSGADASVCGQCALRHSQGGECYVSPWRSGPNAVYQSWQRGNYLPATPKRLRRLRGRAIRFGSYGDPAAVPVAIWQRLAELASLTTGYTHQAQRADPALLDYCMVSVDDAAQAQYYQARGYRTYRLKRPGEPLLEGEVPCPYGTGEVDVQCIDCGLCDGSLRAGRSVAIDAHGIRSRWGVIASDAA